MMEILIVVCPLNVYLLMILNVSLSNNNLSHLNKMMMQYLQLQTCCLYVPLFVLMSLFVQLSDMSPHRFTTYP